MTDIKKVLSNVEQSLTDTEKSQARSNIGAISSDDLTGYATQTYVDSAISQFNTQLNTNTITPIKQDISIADSKADSALSALSSFNNYSISVFNSVWDISSVNTQQLYNASSTTYTPVSFSVRSSIYDITLPKKSYVILNVYNSPTLLITYNGKSWTSTSINLNLNLFSSPGNNFSGSNIIDCGIELLSTFDGQSIPFNWKGSTSFYTGDSSFNLSPSIKQSANVNSSSDTDYIQATIYKGSLFITGLIISKS